EKFVLPADTHAAPLQGRLEQIVGKETTLPAGIKAQALKPRTPVSDSQSQTPVHAGRLVSYPEEWVGHWGGHLILASTTPSDPNFKIGADGVVIFSFIRTGNKIQLLPTNIFLPPVSAEQSRVFTKEQSYRQLLKQGGDALDPKRIVEATPEIELRN